MEFTTIRCDRCKKERQIPESDFRLYVWKGPSREGAVDLCPECSIEFENFMRGGEVKVDPLFWDGR